ncbi:MAG: (2Fe-2S) ferredoxin domain-containing protein [Candidatus Omnitrophota bacterium]|nr:(2Fe-2S) ferredoxin domain-containing protein [Candidatus Omnitrophota bacterium]
MRKVFIDTGGDTCPKKKSKEVMEALIRSIRRAGLEGEVQVIARGCFGLCNIAPNMYVEPEGVWYSRFTLKDVPVIVRQHLRNNRLVKRLVHYPDRLVPAKRKRRTPRDGSARVKRNRSR